MDEENVVYNAKKNSHSIKKRDTLPPNTFCSSIGSVPSYDIKSALPLLK